MKIRASQIASIVLHAAAVFALIHLSAVQELPKNRSQPPLIWSTTILKWHLPPGDSRGGGSGWHELPPSKGRLPRAAPRQYVPPATRPPETMPLLPVEPTIAGQPNPTGRPAFLSDLGDPGARIGPPSDGNQGGTGIGNRGRGGAGRNPGAGAGDGPGGDIIGGLSRTSTLPVILYMIEPEFTEEARKARLQGTVVLRVEIDEKGQVHDIRVQSPLGLGLDEKAVEAVRKWRFKPATRNGKPVRTPALVEVNFHLL